MPEVQLRKLFPNDTFYPEMFSLPEREWLIGHIGDKPSVMDTDPPPEGCNRPTLAAALQRLFDDEAVDAVKPEIVRVLRRSLKLYERKQEVRKRDERNMIPYHQLGVGNGRGQSKFDRTGAVKLSSMTSISEDAFADLLTEQERKGIVVDAESIKQAFHLECGWCEGKNFFNNGKEAVRSVGQHVRMAHEPDASKIFNKHQPHLKRLFNEAEQRIVVIGPEGIELHARSAEAE